MMLNRVPLLIFIVFATSNVQVSAGEPSATVEGIGCGSPQLFGSLIDTKSRYFEAKLATTPSQDEQLALHLGYLDDVKAYEESRKNRAESAVPILASKAMRIDAEIRLGRFQQKIDTANQTISCSEPVSLKVGSAYS